MRAHRETRSRRDFLKAVAITAAAASSAPLSVARAARLGRGNALPGRIVLYQDSGMDGHLANIPGAGHSIHREGFEETMAAILGFLAKI